MTLHPTALMSGLRSGITDKSSVISVIKRADQRSEISLEVFSDPPSGLLRLLEKSSVISVIQRMDQRKLPEKSLISDPPSGLLRLLKKVQ